MNKYIVGAVALIAVGGGVYAVQQGYSKPADNPAPQNNNQQEIQVPEGQTAPEGKTYEITYTDAGFSPSSITIKIGDTIAFVNNSARAFWPASAMHPTHTIYPGSSITKCGTPEEAAIFDSCMPRDPGTSWSFKLTEKGNWNYHDHLNASKYGAIVVE
ncbi:MAG: hypothetical protein Q7S63_03170 [bacterium]|nr:hypothetical protein [bacterium]